MELSNQIAYPPRSAFISSEFAGSNILKLTQEPNVMYPIRKIVTGGKEYMYFPREGGLDLREVHTGEGVPIEGQFIYHHGLLYPQKGHVYPEALNSVNTIKKMVITGIKMITQKELFLSHLGFVILPWPFKKRILQRILNQLDDVAYPILYPHYLLDSCAQKPSLAIKQFVNVFLNELDFKDFGTGNVVSTLFEYDSAYMGRFQDIMSECNKEALIQNPKKELSRLFEIFLNRELGSPKLRSNSKKVVTLLKICLSIPRFKKAFRRACLQTDFNDFRLTEADQYHCLFTYGYDFMGRSFENRQSELSRLHKGKLPIGTEVTGTTTSL